MSSLDYLMKGSSLLMMLQWNTFIRLITITIIQFAVKIAAPGPTITRPKIQFLKNFFSHA
jgi:hypothetical protein